MLKKNMTKKDIYNFNSPNDYMRKTRPELFSDSTKKTKNVLTKNIFEYHLETITNRREETDFEHFCRKLAEKLICPNLIPQTGPTGGGDSKVDSETHPVDEEISTRWYVNPEGDPSKDRWAFAISAKKDWKGKIRSDIKSILSTERNYKLIYFFSNQYIRDKDRATYEDKLSKEFKIDVRIMSREWLVEGVIEKNNIDIAIKTLNIEGYEESNIDLGPKDFKRKKDLEELESNISDPEYYKGVEYQLAKDCLEACFITRGLEESREVLDGKFERAKRIARDNKFSHQHFISIYHHAWTTFWWFEDNVTANKLYDEIEEYCLKSIETSDLQKLVNLFNILYTDFKKGSLDIEEKVFNERLQKIQTKVEELVENKTRPANSLQAKQIQQLLRIFTAKKEDDPSELIPSVLIEFEKILDESVGLLDFPVEATLNLILEMEHLFSNFPEYESLFDKVVSITSKRKSELESGELIFSRGLRLLEKQDYLEAVKYFGKSLVFFSKEESQERLSHSFFCIGKCYENLGLLWGARTNYIHAIDRSLKDFRESQYISPFLLKFLNSIIWLEIRIGRPTHVIYWRELADVIQSSQVLNAEKELEFSSEREMQDAVLATLLLKTRHEDLENICIYPHTLDMLNLQTSHLASLFATGNLKQIEELNFLPDGNSIEDLNEVFKRFLEQPANEDIPNYPSVTCDEKGKCSGLFFGSTINVNFTSLNKEIVAEMIISVFESIWATLLEHRVFPHKETLNVNISDQIEDSNERYITAVSEVKDGETVIKITLGKENFNDLKNIEERQKLKNNLFEVSAIILANVAIIDDLGNVLDSVFGEEGAQNRAILFSEVYIAISNIFGNDHLFDFSRFSKINEGKEIYQNKREKLWNFSDNSQSTSGQKETPVTPGSGGPPEEFFNKPRSHDEISVLSLIDNNIWNKAKWKATAYMLPPQSPSFILLGFTNIEYGREIFKGFINKIGRIDNIKMLRLSIVRGIDKNLPHSYAVIISTDPSSIKGESNDRFILLSRINIMNATNPMNLESFLNHFKTSKTCILAPTSFPNFQPNPEDINNLGIEIKNIVIKYAWEIGPNEVEIAALPADFDPIIPEGVENPPVLEALKLHPRFKK